MTNDDLPEELTCPITRTMFQDPVLVVDSGHTYERSAILSHFERNGAKDPFTNCALSDTRVVTNWAVRQIVQAWLDEHPDVTPDGWDSRALLDPHEVLPQFKFATQLHILRGLSPTLRNRWSFNERPEDWKGVALENGQVVGLELGSINLSSDSTPQTAFWAQLKSFPSLKRLNLNRNKLTSVPAEIGQLTSLEGLYLYGNQLTSLPAEIGQLTALKGLDLGGNKLTSLPAEIGQLTALRGLNLGENQLTSVPAEIRQLTSLRGLDLRGNHLTTLPAEIGQLTSLRELYLRRNRLTTVPYEIGLITSLVRLDLTNNKLTSMPAAIWNKCADDCHLDVDDDVGLDDDPLTCP
jgi:leucine-rich repeat protein SHOC2